MHCDALVVQSVCRLWFSVRMYPSRTCNVPQRPTRVGGCEVTLCESKLLARVSIINCQTSCSCSLQLTRSGCSFDSASLVRPTCTRIRGSRPVRQNPLCVADSPAEAIQRLTVWISLISSPTAKPVHCTPLRSRSISSVKKLPVRRRLHRFARLILAGVESSIRGSRRQCLLVGIEACKTARSATV